MNSKNFNFSVFNQDSIKVKRIRKKYNKMIILSLFSDVTKIVKS